MKTLFRTIWQVVMGRKGKEFQFVAESASGRKGAASSAPTRPVTRMVSKGHEAEGSQAKEFIPSSCRSSQRRPPNKEAAKVLTRFIPPIYVFLLLGGLAGCGPNNEAAGSGGAASGGKATVRLAFFPNVTHGVALIGTGEGTFAKALGSEVKIEEQVFPAGPTEIEALFAGQVDIG
jgi:hypothetical protein